MLVQVEPPKFGSVDEVVEHLTALYQTLATTRKYGSSETSNGGRSNDTRGMDDLLAPQEGVTQMEHALQAANKARMHDSSDAELVVGALLHDCGWLLPKPEDADLLTTSKDVTEKVWLAKHDTVGAAYLRLLGFSDRCAALVEGHVQAKRYLCYKEQGYYDSLSEGSKFTLKHQGGEMTAKEAKQFEQEDDFDLYCLMRRWDEGAKVRDVSVPTWETYVPLLRQALVRSAWARSPGLSSPLRPETLVAPANREALREKGFVVIKNWLSRVEVVMLSNIAEQVANLPQTSDGPFQTFEQTGDGIRPSRTEFFADVHLGDKNAEAWNLNSGTLKDVLGDSSRLEQICSLLLGKDCRLYKEKINYKYPHGSGGYLPHQDLYVKMPLNPDIPVLENAWGNDDVCICMIALDKMTVENGCAQLAVGWHKKGVLHRHDGIRSMMPERSLGQMQREKAWVPMELEQGDVLIYGNHMPHFSERNTSASPRRALFAIYTDALLPQQRELYYERESQSRRKQGSQAIGGKANQFFTGEARPEVQQRKSML